MTRIGKNRSHGVRSGSVILEFMLTMPILLLLFGAAMLWLDLSLGKAHLQESNRNIAWIGNDRYDEGEIGTALDAAATDFYNRRNMLERAFDGTSNPKPFWQFGLFVTNDVESLKKKSAHWTNEVWSLEIPDGYKWGGFYSGNLDLRMTRLSGAYLGAVAVGDVLHPNDAKNPFYKAQYVLTRSRHAVSGTNAVVAASFNPESVVVHRRGDSEVREDVTSPNNLLPVLLDPMPLWGLRLYQGNAVLTNENYKTE